MSALTETLQEKLKAISEQIIATANTANIEYLIRQRFYLRQFLEEFQPVSREYKPEIFRTSEAGTLPPTQSLTISNVGQRDGTITVNSTTTIIKPGESPSWSPPGENYLSGIGYDATGTEFVITYIENL